MFKYASLLGIADMNNKTAVVPQSFWLCDVFQNISAPSVNIDNAIHTGPYIIQDQWRHMSGYYDSAMEKLSPYYDYHIYGFFQSYKYFEHIKERIRTEFTFVPHIVVESHIFISKARRKYNCDDSCLFIGVHVRRGDMGSTQMKNFGYQTVDDMTYFTNAVTFYKKKFKDKKIIFLVCSDDISWCKVNFKTIMENVVFSEGFSSEVDLAILSQCDHSIITTGSFGWWAAYLAGGMTIFYKDWPRPESMLYRIVFKEDYFYPGWIPM